MPSAPSNRDPDVTRTSLGEERVLASGTVIADRYRIEELCGVGGMGMVYRAFDQKLDVEVALKVLRPELVGEGRVEERFRRELLLARQVSHRNVVRIHDLSDDGAVRFLTMDFVHGRSLHRILTEDAPLPPARAADFARQLAEGLAAAHREGVIHRDLKPANVLVDAEDRAYISDFGVARSVAAAGLTRAGSVIGTPEYLSPEQARGEEVDGRSDVYSLGLILFEMLTGQPSFRGTTLSEILGARLTGTPRTTREVGVEVPAALQRIIDRCLSRSPEDRFADAGELAAALEGVASAGGGLGLGRFAFWRRRRWSRQRRWAALALAIALTAAGVLALGAVGGWDWLRRGASTQALAEGGAPIHSVAVLPLSDETGDPELAWTAAGLSELLTTVLAESPDLRVVDSLRILETIRDLGLVPGAIADGDLRQLAELLGVDRVVLGTVRASGGTVRVDARLVAPDGADLTGQRLVAEAAAGNDLFGIVDTLGAELRTRLEVPLATARVELTSSAPALAAYSRGIGALLAGDAVGAAPAFEEAVAADPGFAAGWLRLADAYQQLGYRDRALDAAQRAVRELPQEGGRLLLEARSRAAMLSGDPEEAEEALSALVAHFPHDPEARIALAEALAEAGRFDQARSELERVVRDEPLHPRAWFLLGKFAILSGESRRAADEYLVRALVIQNRRGNDKGRADVLNAMGIAHDDLGESDQALERYREAAEIRERIGDRRGVAATLTNLGVLQFLRGEFTAGRERLEEALAILQEIGDDGGVAALENKFGVLEEERGHYDEALAHFRRSLQMRNELGDRRAQAESFNNVGFSYYLLGDFGNAGVYVQRALALYEESGNREGRVIAQQSLGLLDLARGDWSQALEVFLGALKEARELDLRQAEAVSLGQLGRVAHLQGRYGAALDSYRKAIAVVEALGDVRGLAEFTLFEVAVLVDLGRLEEAESRMEKIEQWVGEAGNQEQSAELARLRGDVELARGRLAQARKAFALAAEEGEASGGALAELGARIGLGRTALASGAVSEAVATLESVVAEAERIGATVLALEGLTALGRAHLAAGDLAPAEEALRRGLRLTVKTGTYHEAWLLHATLAEVLDGRGQTREADRAWSAAESELARIRQALTAEQRAAFEAQPETERVARIARERGAHGRG